MTSIEHGLTQHPSIEAHQFEVLDDDPIGDIRLGFLNRGKPAPRFG